jgi:hypothetical protein
MQHAWRGREVHCICAVLEGKPEEMQGGYCHVYLKSISSVGSGLGSLTDICEHGDEISLPPKEVKLLD